MHKPFALLVLTALAATAFGQSDPGREACRPDARRYCAAVMGSGPEQVRECLIDHQKDISDACYGFLKSALLNVPPTRSNANTGPSAGGGAEACKPDVPKFCKGVQPGNGRIKECLIDHQKEISDACYGFLSDLKSGKTQGGADAGLEGNTSADRAVYKSRQPDGSTVYAESPQPNAQSVKRVQFLNGNTALPLR